MTLLIVKPIKRDNDFKSKKIMMSILSQVQGEGFSVEVLRTRRKKTASVRVQDGVVSIVVPKRISKSQIQEIINAKTIWIKQKLFLYQQAPKPKRTEYVSGESFRYLGKNYRLKFVTGKTSVKLLKGRLVVSLPREKQRAEVAKKAIERWYIEHAEAKLFNKVSHYAHIIGVTPLTVRVKSYKSRWGSCSVNGDIQFNWKIIMAPNHVVDYVVVHELCHIKQHNHSSVFWRLVAEIFPGYKDCQHWLKTEGGKLEL